VNRVSLVVSDIVMVSLSTHQFGFYLSPFQIIQTTSPIAQAIKYLQANSFLDAVLPVPYVTF